MASLFRECIFSEATQSANRDTTMYIPTIFQKREIFRIQPFMPKMFSRWIDGPQRLSAALDEMFNFTQC